MTNNELAEKARAAVINYYDNEKKFGENLIHSLSFISTSLLADAKHYIQEFGEPLSALDRMNMVSILQFDIQGMTHSSEKHREEGTKRARRYYGDRVDSIYQ